ncbi:hypothetical protein LV84_03631 [Algoriphagus ratkowskyi]|uniref:Uncharacterized protein n=1 Tax=Algoriphagus ratkowskyi TaxID=57028 RepID=A0A2W7SMC8_9BACT|nr:hypothetical protein [Algoriphagus ratkowskyi]PZX51872.1 hypothetical protein LV84_03631 [Algoriphagus ratkowskyi]TXD75996.1 hypothetical protein ESW18_18015 [Algoriphagus ratkowskyi]
MSNFLDDLFNKVFKSSEKSPVTHKENVVIKLEEIANATSWMNSKEGAETFKLISKSYHFKTIQIEDKPQTHILDSKYARGFAITYEEPLDEQTFSLLFLAFAQRVLALGYRKVSLDRKMEEINEQVKITDKYYFKPPIVELAANELISQLYGNVAIEKVSMNNQPNYLKVLVTFYSDRLYHDPKPFDHFLDHILEATHDGQI